MTEPLSGIRVVDLSRMVAGPTTAMLLADLGADVVKVEPPSGDDARYMNWRHRPDQAPFFMAANRNKRGIVLDIRAAEGLEVLDELVARADVFIHNFTPAVAEKAGVGFGRLSALNPRLIHCSISAFGEHGPWADRPGIDSLVQAMSGLMSITGEPDGRPLRAGAPIIDTTSPLAATTAILAALRRRDADGTGESISISLLRQAVFMQSPLFAFAQDRGESPGRMGNHSPLALILELAAADGTVLVGIPTEKFWRRFIELLDLAIGEDARLRTQRDRIENVHLIDDAIKDVAPGRTTSEWLDLLAAARLPCAPVLEYDAVAAHPQVQAEELLVSFDDAGVCSGPPWRFGTGPSRPATPPPSLGHDTDAVLAELGLAPARIAALAAAGVTRGALTGEEG